MEARSPDGAKRNPGPASPRTNSPDYAEPVIGRRFAPTGWLHPGYRLFRAREFRFRLMIAEEDEQPCQERQQRQHQQPIRGGAGRVLDPADQIWPAEACEVADRIDQRDPAG